MRLISLDQIDVPTPTPESVYTQSLLGETYTFNGLKTLLAHADYSKAGDRHAQLAAKTEKNREAARTLLSNLTLEHIYENPLTDGRGQIDSVMRVNYSIDINKYQEIKQFTLGQLKNFFLKEDGVEILKIGRGLTGVMVAAVTKLLDVHELIYIAQKIECRSQARTLLGARGTLSSRLQPNHPSDDLDGITFLVYYGLSLASGDALLGVNPAIDSVDNVSKILLHLDGIRKRFNVPTQICVLSHIKTQLACLDKKIPVEIMFQSLAGTESALTAEFDVTVSLLDEAYEKMAALGPLKDKARQFMYFETGQGSEFTYGKHHGIDMTTAEALCYGLARRYDPFMVNNVTGFIGPETHLDNQEMILSNLQDHFMGKLLGLPMGMAPCFTLHSNITLEGQQMATQLLTAAGANYYMDVGLNTDRMLAYFDTSSHDDQTLREIYKKLPTAEFHQWAMKLGLLKEDGSRGVQWGNTRLFCKSEEEYQELLKAVPFFFGVETAGSRPSEKVTRVVRSHHSIAREAVYSEVDVELLKRLNHFIEVESQAKTLLQHLNSPSLGGLISSEARGKIKDSHNQVRVVVAGGLSAAAVNYNIEELYPVLKDGLVAHGLKLGQPILSKYGRVKLAEAIASQTSDELIILLIGERPGGEAEASRSLSAYLAFQLLDENTRRLAASFSGNEEIKFEYSVISNIYSKGIPPMEAGSVIVEKVLQTLKFKAAGNRLENG